MSAAADRQRLAQAQRIAAVKLRRQERERLAAAAAARAAYTSAAAAEAREAAAARAHREARALFFAQPQQVAAEVWLITTDERAQHARSDQQIAAERAAQASADAAAARQAHERGMVRADYLDTRAGALSRAIARCAQDRLDEDGQNRPR